MVHARNRDARRRSGPLPAFPCTDSRRSACGRRPIRQTAPKRSAAARRKAGPYAAGHARTQLHDYTWGLLKTTQETKAVYRPKTRLCNPDSRIVLSGPASAVSCGESAPAVRVRCFKGIPRRNVRLRPQATAIRQPGQPNVRRSALGRTRHALPRSRRETGGATRPCPRSSFPSFSIARPQSGHAKALLKRFPLFRRTRKGHRTRFENLRRHPMPCGATPASGYRTRFFGLQPEKAWTSHIRCIQSPGGALREPRRRGPSPITWTRGRTSRC